MYFVVSSSFFSPIFVYELAHLPLLPFPFNSLRKFVLTVMKRKRVDACWSQEKLSTLEQSLLAVGGKDCFNFIDDVLSGSKAQEECEKALAVVLDIAHEKIHTGNWRDVAEAWRDVYAAGQLAWCTLVDCNIAERLRRLDLALLLGGRLFRQELFRAIDEAGLESRGREGTDDAGQGGCPASLRPQHELLPPNSSADKDTVPRIDLPSIEDFLVHFVLKDRPVIIVGGIEHWPALRKWKDFNYIATVAGNRTIPVEVGSSYLNEDWSQTLVTLSEFIQGFLCDGAEKTGYLAQHELFDQVPKLREDIVVPDYCTLGVGKLEATNAWFGPAGTTSPFHHDPYHNLLAQVVGWKYLRIASPSQGDHLYPYEEGFNTNSSRVDVDNPDYSRYPLFKKLDFKECVLRPGDMLYLPPKWWHFVRSLSISFSVSFWWS